MKHYSLVLISALALLSASCTSSDNGGMEALVENASTQLKQLVASSEAGREVLLPSHFQNGKVEFVPARSWVSGFFAGSLWYMYELTGDEYWARHAILQTEKLDTIQYFTGHHDIGFMLNSSYGNGLLLKGTPGYETVLVNAAKSLSTRFRPGAGIIQSWNVTGGWQAERGWACPVIIDNMMNLELLFKATEISKDSTFFNIAVSHADRTMVNHYRADKSCYHVVDYDPETGEVRTRCTAQGYSDDSAWARGQSWGLYGYTMAYRFTGYERYLEMAKSIERFLFTNPNMPEDLVPYWDFNAPDIPAAKRDVSTACIIASALCELYSFTKEKTYLDEVDKILASLATPAYTAAPGAAGGFILEHSVGSIPHGTCVDASLNYADYYYLEALIRRRALN